MWGNFACGEYSLTLRLTSELVDLRVANANPIRALPFVKKKCFRFCAKMGEIPRTSHQKKKSRYTNVYLDFL